MTSLKLFSSLNLSSRSEYCVVSATCFRRPSSLDLRPAISLRPAIALRRWALDPALTPAFCARRSSSYSSPTSAASSKPPLGAGSGFCAGGSRASALFRSLSRRPPRFRFVRLPAGGCVARGLVSLAFCIGKSSSRAVFPPVTGCSSRYPGGGETGSGTCLVGGASPPPDGLVCGHSTGRSWACSPPVADACAGFIFRLRHADVCCHRFVNLFSGCGIRCE